MAKVPEEAYEAKETDIVFDCRHCGKSLAIDYRGAGLTIPCTDCGNYVEVPIPEGMEIVDIDSTSEEQETRIVHLRRLLTAAEERIAKLEEELESVAARRESLESARATILTRQNKAKESVDVLRAAISAMSRAVESVAAALAEPHE